ECIAFGRFRLFPTQRTLLADDTSVSLSTPAFDLLLALLDAPGSLVSKETLISRAWENRVVSEENLRVQMSALRSALAADRDLILTIPGRGYKFTGVVHRAVMAPAIPTPTRRAAASLRNPTNLPEAVSELIGRDIELQKIAALASNRLVTLTGPGGVGK